MPSRAYKKCEQLMRKAVERGYATQISIHELQLIIKNEIGGDPRTLKNWLSNLRDFGFVRQVNSAVWELQLGRVEGLLELAVREGRQKKLV